MSRYSLGIDNCKQSAYWQGRLTSGLRNGLQNSPNGLHGPIFVCTAILPSSFNLHNLRLLDWGQDFHIHTDLPKEVMKGFPPQGKEAIGAFLSQEHEAMGPGPSGAG